jgi:hypothetical protein
MSRRQARTKGSTISLAEVLSGKSLYLWWSWKKRRRGDGEESRPPEDHPYTRR